MNRFLGSIYFRLFCFLSLGTLGTVWAQCPLSIDSTGHYLIGSYQDLVQLGHIDCAPPYQYRLTADINAAPSKFNGCDSLGQCTGFTSFEFPDTAKVSIRGAGHSIDSLVIGYIPQRIYHGMFPRLNSLTIDSLAFTNFNVNSTYDGGLLGSLFKKISLERVQFFGSILDSIRSQPALFFWTDTLVMHSCSLDIKLDTKLAAEGLANEGGEVFIDSSYFKMRVVSQQRSATSLFSSARVKADHSFFDIYASAKETASGLISSGTFYGKGSRVLSEVISENSSASGVIGYERPYAIDTLRDFTLEAKVRGKKAGGFANYAYEPVFFRNIEANVEVNGTYQVGGLVSYGKLNIDSAKITSMVNGDTLVGGLAGVLYGGDLKNIELNSKVNGFLNTGGLFGKSRMINLKNVVATVDVLGNNKVIENGGVDSITAYSNNVGGISGRDSLSVFSNIEIDATAKGSSYIGGGVGFANGTEIDSSKFTVELSGNTKIGGVSGYHISGHVNKSEVNLEQIKGYFNIGGVTGEADSTLFKNLDIKGNIHIDDSLHASHVGGIVGNLQNTLIDSSTYNGDITAYSFVGGIAGVASKSDLRVLNAKGDFKISGVNSFFLGGIVGDAHESVMLTSQFEGSLVGGICIGGLAGSFSKGHLIDGFSDHVSQGDSRLGGLVGFCYNSTIIQSVASSQIAGSMRLGGICGLMVGGFTDGVVSRGSIQGDSFVGGLVGDQTRGNLNMSWSDAEVNGNEYVGGLVGRSKGKVFRNRYVGSVQGKNAVGGIVGSGHLKILANTNAGFVSGHSNVGGIVGYYQGDSTELNQDEWVLLGDSVYYNQNFGTVIGDSIVGGIAGYHEAYYSTIDNLNAGIVQGRIQVAGLVGLQHSTVRKSLNTGPLFCDTLCNLIALSAEGTPAAMANSFHHLPFDQGSQDAQSIDPIVLTSQEVSEEQWLGSGWVYRPGLPGFTFALVQPFAQADSVLLTASLDPTLLLKNDRLNLDWGYEVSHADTLIEFDSADSLLFEVVDGKLHFNDFTPGDSIELRYRFGKTGIDFYEPLRWSNQALVRVYFIEEDLGVIKGQPLDVHTLNTMVRLYNATGALVYQGLWNENVKQSLTLTPGIYTLQNNEKIYRWTETDF